MDKNKNRERRKDEAYKIKRGSTQRAQNPVANDKNLYRDIRLGRIVNLNGRVIGSIVKRKEKEKKSAKMASRTREARRRDRERKENQVGSKTEEIRRVAGGCLHNFLS